MPKTIILIVDDEPMVQNVCATVLRTAGFEPVTAVNGLEGFDAYQAACEEICLVISDIRMPGMSGVELARKLFDLHSHPNVILMSGADGGDLVPDDLRRLCSVLAKPFTSVALLDAVKKCLRYEEEPHPSPEDGLLCGEHKRLMGLYSAAACKLAEAGKRLADERSAGLLNGFDGAWDACEQARADCALVRHQLLTHVRQHGCTLFK